MEKHTATEAMDIFETVLRSQPDVMALHVGFFKQKSVLFVSVPAITPEVESRIHSAAPGAPLKLIITTTGQVQPASNRVDEPDAPVNIVAKKQLSAKEASQRYGKDIKKIKSVSSVNIGRRSGKKVLTVRAFPITNELKSRIRAAAPGAPLNFCESRHPKVSNPSIIKFILTKLKGITLALFILGILFSAFAPLYTAMADMQFSLVASTAEGIVVSSERPIADTRNKDDITQEITIKFLAMGREITFTSQVTLFQTLGNMGNMNAEPYHKGSAVSVAFLSSNPPTSARIFDRKRFWATLAIYLGSIVTVMVITYTTWRRWEEW